MRKHSALIMGTLIMALAMTACSEGFVGDAQVAQTSMPKTSSGVGDSALGNESNSFALEPDRSNWEYQDLEDLPSTSPEFDGAQHGSPYEAEANNPSRNQDEDHHFDVEQDSDPDDDASEDELIRQFLSLEVGERSEFDLTNGEVLVAGPAQSGQVVLACSRGTLYVAAGTAVGALGAAMTVGGIASGPGAAAVVPASIPVYGFAGGLIGLAAASPSWHQCLGGLATLAMALLSEGYHSVFRGMQAMALGISRGRPAISAAPATVATSDCAPGTRQCNQMTRRYHRDFCDPLSEWRDRFGTDIHQADLCSGTPEISCADLQDLIFLAAGCWEGRKAVTQRCFGGRSDPGHRRALEYAEADFFSCIDLMNWRSDCLHDSALENRSLDAGNNAFPECH